MTAALAAASARYGVSVAERLATDGRGGYAACFLSGIPGWRVGTLYPLAGWQPRRAAGRQFLFDEMTAALAAASARYGVSVAERLATDGRGGSAACFLWNFRLAGRYSLSIGGVAAAPRRGQAISFSWNDGGVGRGVGEVCGSVAERLATDGRGGSAACFLSGISGWQVGTLYPLAGWQPRRAAGRQFLFDAMTAALAAASARYGVSVAERLATDGRGGSAACFLSGISGWRVGTLDPLAGWQPRRAAGRQIIFDEMTAALARRRRGMGSASPSGSQPMAVVALRRAFSLKFPAGASVLFIHWRGGSRAARRAGDFFLMESRRRWPRRRRAMGSASPSGSQRWPWWLSGVLSL